MIVAFHPQAQRFPFGICVDLCVCVCVCVPVCVCAHLVTIVGCFEAE